MVSVFFFFFIFYFFFHPLATPRYLMRPNEHVPFVDLIYNQSLFTVFHFTICWRITHEIADFINEHLNPNYLFYATPTHKPDEENWDDIKDEICAAWGEGIRANPNRAAAPGSVEVIPNGWKEDHKVVDRLQSNIRDRGYNNVAVIAFSLNKSTPLRKLVNSTANDIPWYLMDTENKCQRELSDNKVFIHSVYTNEQHAIFLL